MKILAIDTSCDETSVAISEDRAILANIVSSQVELHKKWGGVVPDIARRAHIENLPIAVEEVLKRAKLQRSDLDLIAATQGPGLAIDLEVGLQYAQKMAVDLDRPFAAVNHMEGHLLSGLILNSRGNGLMPDLLPEKVFPALGLLVSGKHTEIILMKGLGNYEKIGETLDDAAGEAFDKVGRMLDFGYPGGPIVSQFAKKGKINELISLPIPMERSDNLNFSYSGLKTACLYRIKQLREDGHKDKEWINDFCFTFVNSIAQSLSIKLKRALRENPDTKTLFVGGGVYKNEYITRKIGSICRENNLTYLLPQPQYRGDNAAMIAVAAWAMSQRGDILNEKDAIEAVDRIPRNSL